MVKHDTKNSILFRMLFIVTAFVSLGIGIYNMCRVASRPNDECSWVDTDSGVHIVSVKTGGTAARAGLRQNDLLLRIAGENAVTSLRAQMILSHQKVGESVGYLILRGDELLEIQVGIVRGGFDPIYLTMCCVGFIYLIVGLWIGWMRPDDRKSRVLFLLFLSFMLFWTLNVIPFLYGSFYYIALILRTLSFATIPVFFLIFFLLYPTEHSILRKNIWIHILLISPAILVLIWFILALVFGYPSPVILPVGIGLWGLYFSIGLNRLGNAYKRAKGVRLRYQIRILRWGITLGSIPPFLLIIPALLELHFPLGHYSAPLMGFIPLVFAYAIVRHRLMDIEFIVKKSFVYTLLTGLVVGFYFLVVQFMGRFLQDVSGQTETVVLIFSTLFVAILFAPVRGRIQHIVDRAFYREAYDYRVTLRQFTRTLNTLMKPDILMETVLAKLCQTMLISDGYFFLENPVDQSYTVVKEWPSHLEKSVLSIKDDGFLCQMLLEEKTPIFLSELHRLEEQKQMTVELSVGVLAVPLLLQNKLLGFLILGEKLSEIPYSTEDLDLLATLADQVTVALENGRLHRALTEQERMKHELEIARQIQLNSLPQKEPTLSGFDIYGCSIPATEVGGDYYDYLYMPDGRLCLIIGDVSGKGTSAAFYVSQIQAFFRALISTNQALKDLLCRVNSLAFENIEEKSFVTLVAAFIQPDEKSLTLVRAGHTSIFFFQKEKNVLHQWAPPGIALALNEGEIFNRILKEEKKQLARDDVLLFYSDGVTEAINEDGEEFGENRLREVFHNNVDLAAKPLGEAIIKHVNNFAGDQTQGDDITLVVLKVTDNVS